MLNAINASFLKSYQGVEQFNTQPTNTTKATAETTNPVEQFGSDVTVEISDEGLNALANSKTDEAQLSDKAKNFLADLRKKYGNYDFIVSNDMDTSKTVGSTKEYSVMFTAEDIEKMAEDEDYAEKMMGQVGNAVDMLKDLSQKDLGEGVQYSQLSVSFDSEGNMKLFAQLEKLSADQQERLDAAKEKRAEDTKTSEKQTQAKNEESEFTSVFFKAADVEASSPEELYEKILGLSWKEIPEQEAKI